MGRVNRTSLPDGFFHIVSRAVCGAQIFVDDVDRRAFLRSLRHCETTYSWTRYAFCLMATHYHLVVEARREDLSKGLQQLNGRYARAFNQRHERYGHLFGERYSVRRIESEQYLLEACSYVLLNPVKARLCDRVEEWPWSYSRFGTD